MGNYYLTNKDMDKAKDYFEKFYQIEPSEELRTFIDGLGAPAK